MYDMPEVAGALDTLWSALARKLADDDSGPAGQVIPCNADSGMGISLAGLMGSGAYHRGMVRCLKSCWH